MAVWAVIVPDLSERVKPHTSCTYERPPPPPKKRLREADGKKMEKRYQVSPRQKKTRTRTVIRHSRQEKQKAVREDRVPCEGKNETPSVQTRFPDRTKPERLRHSTNLQSPWQILTPRSK